MGPCPVSYSTIFDSRRFVRSDSPDTTFLLPVSAGGSGANLGTTGGANQVVRQSSIGAAFTVGILAAADIPNLDASKITTGLLALARGGTGVDLSAGGSATSVLAQDASHVVSARALVAGDIPSLDASKITTGQLALARGGTNADLSGGGSATAFLAQDATHIISARSLGAGDVPDVALTSNVGLLNRNSQSWTGTPQLFANGSAAAPSIAFANSTTTGLFRSGTDILGFATAGVQRVAIGATGAWALAGAAATNLTFDFTGSTTSVTRIRLTNTSGDMQIGVDSSAGGILMAGGTAYDGVINVIANQHLRIATNNTIRTTISKAGSMVHGTAALATNATDGFIYIPTCAGIPTGTPTAWTGTVAMIYDSTNNNFYVFNSAWKKVALA